jgi:hypothetical protein
VLFSNNTGYRAAKARDWCLPVFGKSAANYPYVKFVL